MTNDGELKLESEDYGKLVCVNTVAPNWWTHTRLHLNCQEIELNTNNVKIVLDNDKLSRELETCDYIELNGFIFRKEEK